MANSIVISQGKASSVVALSLCAPQEWTRQQLLNYLFFQEEYKSIDITMPCGEKLVAASVCSVSLVDVPCPCGDPTHWLVKWQIEA